MCYNERLGLRRSNRIGLLIAPLVLCVIPSATAQQSKPFSQHEHRYANAKRQFESAIFYKPERVDGVLSIELAPLIVLEVSPKDADKALHSSFGAVVLDTSGKLNINLAKPTVYFDERRIMIHGREYTERVFALYFRPREHGVNAGQLTTVHLVLDADGFPLAGLALEQMTPERRRPCGYAVFVSEPLEERAKDRFGEPLPGCRYSIERGPRHQCSPTVPNVLPTGPIPMGPYIYLDKRGNVTTLLCRCSPSQMNDVVETREYRLQPIERALAIRGELAESQRIAFPVPGSAESTAAHIEQALRWPIEPPTDAKSHEDR